MHLQNINLYRIVHRDNVGYILKNGMFCSGHASFDPTNIFIGDSTLTQQRFAAKLLNRYDYVPNR